MAIDRQPPHIVLFPSPGMGHLIPLAEFAKRLVLNRNFTVTLISFTDLSSKTTTSFLDTLPANFSSILIPSIPLDDLPADAHFVRLIAMMDRSVPHLRDILLHLKQSKGGVAAYISDLFARDTMKTAKELGIPSYLCFTPALTTLSMFLHLPALHESTTCEYRELVEPVVFPGCVPLRGEDLISPAQDRSKEGYKYMLDVSRMIKEVDGILVNSIVDIEPGAYKALKEKEEEGVLPTVVTIGPLVSVQGWGESYDECLIWLDSQPEGSVIFVSFGSGGTLSSKQLDELAYGLEASGQRFLWVLRRPDNTKSSGTYFGLHGNDDVLSCLPDGFLERTQDVGLVVPLWAPQVKVLNHRAVNGFLSHCGWNSVLESLLAGVPLITWPLFAEQRMNAVMLSEGAGVALRLKAGDDRVYGREEIARVVKELMEGEGGTKAREKMRQLRAAGFAALDKGGASYEAIAELAEKWERLAY